MKIQPHIIWTTALLAFASVVPLNAQSGKVEAASVRSVESLEKRVDNVEARLGRNVTTPTATNNLERRLDDIEDRLDDLEKKMKDLEKLERRVRDLERKK